MASKPVGPMYYKSAHGGILEGSLALPNTNEGNPVGYDGIPPAGIPNKVGLLLLRSQKTTALRPPILGFLPVVEKHPWTMILQIGLMSSEGDRDVNGQDLAIVVSLQAQDPEIVLYHLDRDHEILLPQEERLLTMFRHRLKLF